MNYVPQQQTIIANKKNIVQYCTLFCDLLLILLFYSVLTSVQTRHTKCCYVLFDIKISKPKQKELSRCVSPTASHAQPVSFSFLFFLSALSHPHKSPPLFLFLFLLLFLCVIWQLKRHLKILTAI
uniref:(northern house mosquito) hypothetical protein n=1 Tax=Culex pipiens TaxID=7175 RepID=A0A8D8IQ33_CULPI